MSALRPGHHLASLLVGDGTNQLSVDPDGSLALEGDARSWTDLDFAQTIRTQGSATPTLTNLNGTGIYDYAFANGKEAYFKRQVPHQFREGTPWRAHVHWLPTTADTYTGSFTLDYVWHAAASGSLSAKQTIGPIAFDHADMSAYQVQITPLAELSDETALSAIIYCRLAVALSSGASIILAGFDFHGQIDAFGSRQEFTK